MLHDTIITLSNGKRVGCLMLPYSLKFSDGKILKNNYDGDIIPVSIFQNKKDIGDKGDFIFVVDNQKWTEEVHGWIDLHNQNKVDGVFVDYRLLPMVKNMFPELHAEELPFRFPEWANDGNTSITKQGLFL